MRTKDELERLLDEVDRRGYPAYRRLAGAYGLGWLQLLVDHVQRDPFAAPSQVSVRVPAGEAGIPVELLNEPHRRRAVEDLLVRRLSRELARFSFRAGGSGKSGLLVTSRPGPEILPRSACEVGEHGDVTLRMGAGFPARGRTADARALGDMLLDYIPAAVDAALDRDELPEAARRAAELADDQREIRAQLGRRGLVAYVADGAVLPREIGVSARPLKGAKPFRSPGSLAVELDLPHAGRVRGMGVPEGVTLIVGGGYHGKSTLLRALQEGVYDHIAGDGRELVATRADAVKLRAEDGRPVRDADISLFIGDLPDGRDTRRFSTGNASGSTSQAAATMEALGSGCRTLLIDEDTSATNFMVRDELMEAVVARDAEPITPFSDRVSDLRDRAGVSCVIVAGSSGAFFPASDTVIQMQDYEPHDITERTRGVCRDRGACEPVRAAGFTLPAGEPGVRISAAAAGGRGGHGARGVRGGHGSDRLKVRTRGLDEVSVGGGAADLRLVEQLVDPEQAAAIAQLIRMGIERGLLDGSRTAPEVSDALLGLLDREGWSVISPRGAPACGLARPRREELVSTIHRWRS